MNRVLFKQLFQADAIDYCQLDSARLGSVNEILAVTSWPRSSTFRCARTREASASASSCSTSRSSTSSPCPGRSRPRHGVRRPPARALRRSLRRRQRPLLLPEAPGYSAEMLEDSVAAYFFPRRLVLGGGSPSDQPGASTYHRLHLTDGPVAGLDAVGRSRRALRTAGADRQLRRAPEADSLAPGRGITERARCGYCRGAEAGIRSHGGRVFVSDSASQEVRYVSESAVAKIGRHRWGSFEGDNWAGPPHLQPTVRATKRFPSDRPPGGTRPPRHQQVGHELL